MRKRNPKRVPVCGKDKEKVAGVHICACALLDCRLMSVRPSWGQPAGTVSRLQGRRQTRPSALCTHTSAFLVLNRFCFNDYVSDTVIVRKARMLPHLCTIFFVLLAAVSCGCTPGTLSSEDQIPGEGQLVVVIFHLNSRRDT